ncbi:hypothetical protein VTJ83DRAFT_4485 [Remersonia thermophila]|uniref:RNA polymerase II holoenzyme cyclin-like subunit n=1 Tax=Remersonia thermophila TaxID=72144 RepID=A0ABR4DA52_9PEZI
MPHSDRPPAPGPPPPPADDAKPIGPPSGILAIPSQWNSEQGLQQSLKQIGWDEKREDGNRLKGVQLIDAVRQSLHLPVKTFDTAAIYYHKFRVRFPSSDYNYEDVALAALFVACKAEDTIKKSREILCAAHGLRQPHDRKTPDDKMFEAPSRLIISLERHMLETIGFDFRVQYPQKLLIKMARKMYPRGDPASDGEGKEFLRVAYNMSIDMYKTFAPVKQTTFTMALAILELTARLLGTDPRRTQPFQDAASWHSSRACVLETILDLLDLYTRFQKGTKVGVRFDLQTFMDVKIELNNLLAAEKRERYAGWCDRCGPDAAAPAAPADARSATPGSATSPAANLPAKRKMPPAEGTQRFIFDADQARQEQAVVARYFHDEYEEHEMEVEEPIPEPEPPRNPGRGGMGNPSYRGPGPGEHGRMNHPRTGRQGHGGGGRRDRRGGGGGGGGAY